MIDGDCAATLGTRDVVCCKSRSGGWPQVSIKMFLIVLLFIVVLAGATGGDESVTRVGDALGQLAHWVNVAWTALTD